MRTMGSGVGKYLFIVSSSYGHLFPAIRLAHVLQSHGGDVLFVAARENQFLLESQGLKCVCFSGQPHPFLSTYNWYESYTGQQQYQLIRAVADAYRPDTIVGTPLALPAFILSELCSTPLIVIGYCEYLFPGVGDTGSAKQWRIESITRHYNELRQRLGLPAISADPADSPLIGDIHLIRSVPQFTARDGMPPCVKYVGALLWEPAYVNHDLDRFVAARPNRESPIFYVQIGRLFEEPHRWERLVRLLGDAPARFIVDLGRSDYLSDHAEFPDNFYLHPFIPMGHVKDEISGVICSGQTTSVLSALFHGKPMLGIPNSGDGAEVTRRIVDHGVGTGIFDPAGLEEAVLSKFIHSATQGCFQTKVMLQQSSFQAHDDDARLFAEVSS